MRSESRLFMAAAALAAASIGVPAPAVAQQVSFSIRQTEACLSSAPTPEAARECIGLSANACMAAPLGGSTMGANACIDGELGWWDQRLNAAYKGLLHQAAGNDAEFPPPEGQVGQTDALRNMQRAWIAFRDATCEYEYTQWFGGSGGSPAYSWCMMRMTAEQAIYLENTDAAG